MDKKTELDARYEEGVAWRSTVRTEDVAWRKGTRKEDKEWREVTREEDKEWRMRVQRLTNRCHALVAAAQASKPSSSLEEILGLAQQFESWLNREDK